MVNAWVNRCATFENAIDRVGSGGRDEEGMDERDLMWIEALCLIGSERDGKPTLCEVLLCPTERAYSQTYSLIR
jgi:hypothetical protein